MRDHVPLIGMILAPPNILDQFALMRHQRIVDANNATRAVARVAAMPIGDRSTP
jgi:hypothetical protein